MDCPAALREAFPESQSELDELCEKSKTFREIVVDYQQMLAELAAQFSRDGGPNKAAVRDISAALSELENDVHEALVKHQTRGRGNPNRQQSRPKNP